MLRVNLIGHGAEHASVSGCRTSLCAKVGCMIPVRANTKRCSASDGRYVQSPESRWMEGDGGQAPRARGQGLMRMAGRALELPVLFVLRTRPVFAELLAACATEPLHLGEFAGRESAG